MDGVEGFEKSQYPLFGIHTHLTPSGHIFVNFDAEESPQKGFEEWFGGLEGEMNEFSFDEYEYHSSFVLEGEFNWKTLMDGYQECYRMNPWLNEINDRLSCRAYVFKLEMS